MIIGIDIGNYATKTSSLVIFDSKVTNNSLLGKNPFEAESDIFYVGEGNYDTEYRKVKKKHIRIMFLYALTLSTNDINNKIVVGLPISQYKADREEMKQLLMQPRMNVVSLNGIQRKLYIEDVEVYPEGLISVEDGILVDIGGRTTEVALVENFKVTSSFSVPEGTLNLYSDFANLINTHYGLDLKQSDAERIIRHGLKIDGMVADVTFAQDAFRSFVENLVSQIQIKYPVKTLPVTILGGGGQLLFNPIKKRIPNSTLAENPVFANALLFKKVGEAKWL